MVEKILVKPGNSDSQTLVELVSKVNEVVTALGTGRQQPRTQPLSLQQQADQMGMMIQRMLDIPYKTITTEGTNALTDAIGRALESVKVALIAYRESL